jgi:hypothetical protein
MGVGWADPYAIDSLTTQPVTVNAVIPLVGWIDLCNEWEVVLRQPAALQRVR